jgi:hypothetical protein
MLVKSLIDGNEWLWVNIPKTATTSTMKSFFPNRQFNNQSHNTYKDLIRSYGYRPAFSVVRNPIHRFMSGLNHIFSVCECGKCIVHTNEPPTTEDVIYFVRDMLNLKNTIPNFFEEVYKNGVNTLYTEVINSIQFNFQRSININTTANCLRWTLILPQSHQLAGANNIQIFKYEDINTFFHFVKKELGYNITDTRYRSYSNKLMSVDVNNSTLIALLYELHKEDFINFNYSV